MPSTTEVLAAAGIQRAAEVVDLAAAAHLDIACAAVLLLKESGGGKHVWGHDAVSTGGAYTRGGPVTKENYLAYRALVRAGTIGRQGCSATQLTYGPLQDEADRRGGCWDWRTNCTVGFEHLRALIVAHGEQDGFRRYNGSGPAAEAYGRDAVARLTRLRQQLATAAPPAPSSGGADLRKGDRGPEVFRLQTILTTRYPAYAHWSPVTDYFGDQTDAAVREFQRRSGLVADGVVGPLTRKALGL